MRATGAIAGFANDLYLAMARDLDEGSVIRPFDRVRVIPTTRADGRCAVLHGFGTGRGGGCLP